jgi:hypothetical protein
MVDRDHRERVDQAAERAHAQDDRGGVELVHELDDRPALRAGEAEQGRLEMARELAVEGLDSRCNRKPSRRGLACSCSRERSSEVA